VWICALVVLWPWLASLGLTVTAFFVPAAFIQGAWAVPLFSSYAAPVAVFVMVTFVVSKAA